MFSEMHMMPKCSENCIGPNLKYWSREKKKGIQTQTFLESVLWWKSLIWEGILSISSNSCSTGSPGLNVGKDSPLWLIFKDIYVTHVYDKITCWREGLIYMFVFLEIKLYLNQNNIFSLLKYLNVCFLVHYFFIDSDVIFCPPYFYENRGALLPCGASCS